MSIRSADEWGFLAPKVNVCLAPSWAEVHILMVSDPALGLDFAHVAKISIIWHYDCGLPRLPERGSYDGSNLRALWV